AVIRANAETLLAGAKDDPHMADRLMEGLHRNAERLARLIADLLDLSRLDAGQYRMELAPLSVKTAAEHALTAIGARGHPLRIEVSPELIVKADRKALDQVLVNLLENAVRYTPEGTEVSLLAFAADDRVRLEVRDLGPGIAPAHRDRVFERFYRADPGRVREAGGTGLGLSIVKHLMESMGGDVRLLPNQPTGCNFVLHLPRG
ncbi:MAG TPA: ATP-binding protein, partial [Kofleriaceae bacterium]|nr:ATP-binding protein [Kofleriaceae bacterium]